MTSRSRAGKTELSKSMSALDTTTSSSAEKTKKHGGAKDTGTAQITLSAGQVLSSLTKAQSLYNSGSYSEALTYCEKVYQADAYRTDNLLLLGAVHFQLRNFSESIFYNQQCIRVDPNFAEAYSNLGNALKELGDLKGATQFYLKVSTSYNNKDCISRNVRIVIFLTIYVSNFIFISSFDFEKIVLPHFWITLTRALN